MLDQVILYESNSDLVPMCNQKGCILYSPHALYKCFLCHEKERIKKDKNVH